MCLYTIQIELRQLAKWPGYNYAWKQNYFKDKLFAFTRNPYIGGLWEVIINSVKVLLLKINKIFRFYFVCRGTDPGKNTSDYGCDNVYSLREFFTVHRAPLRSPKVNTRDTEWHKKQYQHFVSSRQKIISRWKVHVVDGHWARMTSVLANQKVRRQTER